MAGDGKRVRFIHWLVSGLNHVPFNLERSMKYTQNVYVTITSQEICNAVVSVQENTNFLF